MSNDEDIRTWLHGTATRAPLQPLEPGRLVQRGRRGRRRRRLFAGAGAVAAVAAVAVATSTLPNLGDANRIAPIATPTATKGTAATGPFTPVPGVPHGEAALGEVGQAEAARRCHIRYPDIRRVLDLGFYRAGSTVRYKPTVGDRFQSCTVPGDSRPKASTVAAATADPMPSKPADILRNCSVLMWHDLTAWRVVTSDRQPGVQLVAVALSPSGKHVAYCQLTPTSFAASDPFAGQVDGIWSVRPGGERNSLEHFGQQGSQMCGTTSAGGCVGWMFYDAGRVASNVARIRLTAKNGHTHDIPVRDGWYALAWADGNPKGQPDAKITAYDAKGKRIFG